MGGAEEVESHLLPSIREHLNNEIGLLTVRSASDCEAWLRSTYLGVRIAARPGHYAAQVNVDLRRDGAEGIVREICKRAVEDLSSLEMVRSDPTTGKLEQLEPGRILSHCYLRLDTLKNFQGCRDHLSLEGSLWLVAASRKTFWRGVFSDLRGLSGFPSCGTKNLRDPLAFRAFSERLSARRMTVWSNSAPDSDQHCTQIPGVGQVIANRLVKAGLSRLDDLEGATAQVIEGAAQRPFPFGSKIKSEVKKLPPRVEYSMLTYVIYNVPIGRQEVVREVCTDQSPCSPCP